MSWQHISPEVTVKGFKKRCLSSAVDGTNDESLWNGSEENGNFSSEGEEDEATDCEDGDSSTDW
jgi:hypothetical protein